MTEPKTYVALKPCGCLAIAILDIVDKTGNRSHVIAKGIRQGYSFTLMETQAVRTMPWTCNEHRLVSQYLSPEELKELLELYQKTRTSIALSLGDALAGNDFNSVAVRRFKEKWDEIAIAHGVSFHAGFNSETGEILP